MESLLHDLRFGARILARSPGITLAIILTLALGIGANSAMFSVVDAALLHPFHYREPDKLALLIERDPSGSLYPASAGNFFDWRANSKSFEEIAAWSQASYLVKYSDRADQTPGAAVTWNFFRTLGVKPELGRTFLPDEDGIDHPDLASHVAVISHRMWVEKLGSDPNVLGRPLNLNSNVYAIVGVMPPDFQFLGRAHNVWIPLSINRTGRDYHYLTVVGRFRGSWQQAQAEMTTIARQIEGAYPASNRGWTVQLDDLKNYQVKSDFRRRVVVLFWVVALVLLMACSNVASLLMARSSSRLREIAARLSLGATRGRMARQLLTENLMLSVVGGALGLLLAWGLIGIAPKIVPPNAIPAATPVRLNTMVVLFTLGASLATGLLFGLAPAIAATRPDLQEALKDASRGSTEGQSRQRFRKIVVTAEFALATVLLTGAGLMIESLVKLNEIDLGLNPANVLTMRIYLPPAKYGTPEKVGAYIREAVMRLRALPGAESASASSSLPLERIALQVPFDLETNSPRPQGEKPAATYLSVGPQYLETLGIPLRYGRAFSDRDDGSAPPVILVSESFARHYFGSEDVVGKRILLDRPAFGRRAFEGTIRTEIVGVVGDIKLSDLGAGPAPIIYGALGQNVFQSATRFAIRTGMDPSGLAAAARRELATIDRDLPVEQLTTLNQTFLTFFVEPRFQAELMGTFAGIALLLAVVGIYGVSAYAVASRKHEIGIRMALGATPRIVLRQIFAEGMRNAGIGILLGAMASFFVAGVLKSLLVGVTGGDPRIFAWASLALLLAAAAACYFPARRATRVDPATALHME